MPTPGAHMMVNRRDDRRRGLPLYEEVDSEDRRVYPEDRLYEKKAPVKMELVGMLGDKPIFVKAELARALEAALERIWDE